MKRTLSYSTAALLTSLVTLSAFASSSQPPKDGITLRQARKAATRAYSGQIESHELKEENGKWVYSFDIHGKDAVVHEVLIDAKSGAVISNNVETKHQIHKEMKQQEQEEKDLNGYR